MDPNETLSAIRHTVMSPGNLADYDRLCELVDGLDQWLSKGGFLPAPWDPRCAENFRGCTHMGPHFHG